MNKQAVLFFDIDGTLFNFETKKMPTSAKQALSQARKRGHILLINTGRTRCSVPMDAIDFLFDGYLCGCGTHLSFGEEVLLESHIAPQRGEEIIALMKECQIEGILEGTKDCYFSQYTSRFEAVESTRRYFENYGIGMETYIEQGGFIFDKLYVYTDEKSDVERFKQEISLDMDVIDRRDGTLEVVQKGYSKGTACKWIQKKLNNSTKDLYVFGDSANDLPMFTIGAHTIAMGCHDAKLEPYTEFVTKKVEEDGIKEALIHYGLI